MFRSGVADRYDDTVSHTTENAANISGNDNDIRIGRGQDAFSCSDRDGLTWSKLGCIIPASSDISEKARKDGAKLVKAGRYMQSSSRSQKVKERLLPRGTRRWYYYRIGRTGIAVILNEGWRNFWLRAKPFLQSRLRWQIGDRYKLWIERNEPKADDLEKQKLESLTFKYRPKISVVTPVWNPDEKWLRLTIESVINQTYDNWELCLADSGSTKPKIREILEEYAEKDSRIKVKFLPQNKGIVGNSNEALSLTTSDFVALLDHDRELAPFALYECVRFLNNSPEADFMYSDEDEITNKGKRINPSFKPDWSPDMLLSYMYTGHLGIYRKRILDEIGGFREGYDGSQDYDLVLRFIEKTSHIYHVAKILCHRRILLTSAASISSAKAYAYLAGRKALSDYLARNNIRGEVLDGTWSGSYRVKREILGNPLVSIIIPTSNNAGILKKCLDSVLSKTEYSNYEILVIDNQSTDFKTLDYYRKLGSSPKIRLLQYDSPFNFSASNNYAVSQANGEHLLFLNDDTEVISGEWLSAMLEHSQRREVGAVGARLLYPSGAIQHCGVILGLGVDRVASHAFSRCPDYPGYLGRIKIINNYSAVTAACMMIRKQVFEEIGGLDEELTRSYNDIDLCLKIREKGYVIVYTPYANLYHLESYTRGYDDTHEKRLIFRKETEYMRAKWGTIIDKGDPYYSPNLSLERTDFSVNR